MTVALAPPGTEYGPCTEPCAHIDCASSREMAESTCPACREAIGYDRAFFYRAGVFVHAVCLFAEANTSEVGSLSREKT